MPSRIEEEVVVAARGCRVITLFPAENLPIANAYRVSGHVGLHVGDESVTGGFA